MKSFYSALLPVLLLLPGLGHAQTTPPPTERVLVVSPAVGEVIDRAEKAKFGLFIFYSADEFGQASFYRSLTPDSLITLRTQLADGRQKARPYSQEEFLAVRKAIERRLKELGDAVPAAAPLGQGTPEEPLAADKYPFALGSSYRIETRDGTVVSGELTSMSLVTVEITARDGSRLVVPRTSITRVVPANGAAAPVGVGSSSKYYDIGNGNRVFFSPTGRNLRRNEGSLEDIDVYLVGLNYGLTDNVSLGGYFSVIPTERLENQLLVLTPKFSVRTAEKVHLGVGLLYARIPTGNGDGIGAGVGYGVATYGTADNNVTAGLGYGFVNNSVGSTPVLLLSGQTRVSRRISLMSENYIVADADAGMAGLYGIKLSWRRLSLGLGAGYLLVFNRDPSYYGDPDPQNFFTSYVIPVYVNLIFRFGKGAQPQ